MALSDSELLTMARELGAARTRAIDWFEQVDYAFCPQTEEETIRMEEKFPDGADFSTVNSSVRERFDAAYLAWRRAADSAQCALDSFFAGDNRPSSIEFYQRKIGEARKLFPDMEAEAKG